MCVVRRVVFVLMLLAIASNSFAAGPFGLEHGMSLQDLKRIDPGLVPLPNNPGVYVMEKVPNPHPLFSVYLVYVSPSCGVFMITAMTDEIRTNMFGDSLKSTFNELVERLSMKYGPPTTYIDRLKEGSLWTEPEEWMMSMVKSDRTLSVRWESSEAAGIPYEMERIVVGVLVTKYVDRGRIGLSYVYTGKEDCEQEVNRSVDDAL